MVYVPKGNLHRYRNTGERTGRLLVVHTPGGSRELFVEAAGEPATDGTAPLAADEPLDAERIVAIGAEYGIEMVPPPP